MTLYFKGYGQTALTGEDLAKFVPLCQECQTKVQYKDNGKKRELVQVQTAYSRLLREKENPLPVSV